MNTRATGIARTLGHNPLARGMLAVIAHEGQVDGMGYKVDHVRPGRGFSAIEYSSKKMANGRHVACRTYYPGVFDGMTGLPTEITTTYSVWVGWEEYNLEYEKLYASPPLELPPGAVGWGDNAQDGPRDWYAEFDDGKLAEAFASKSPPIVEGVQVAPLCRIDSSGNM